MEREEFIVPRANVPSLKSSNGCVLVMRAEKLFSCSVEVSDNGDALGEWVTVLGEKENARRAKDYILAGCEEQEGMNIPFTADLLDEPSGTFFERLEYSSCAVVSVRRNGYINIRGSPVAMATALSIIQCHQAESSASTPVPMSSSRSSTSTPVPMSSSCSSTPVPMSSSCSSTPVPVPMSSSRSSAVDTSPTGKHTPSQQAGDSKTCSLATSSYQPVHNDGLQVHSRVSQQASSQSKPQLACSFSKPSKPVSARTETVKQKPTVSPSPSMPHSSAHAVISTLSSTTNLSPIHVHAAAITTTTSGTTTATGSGAVSSLMLPSDVSVWQAVSRANASSSVATVSTSSMNRTSMTNDDNSSHARKHKCGAAGAATAASTPRVVGNAERQSIASASSTPVGMSRTDAATSTAVTTAGRGAATSTAITTASAAASTAGRSASAAGAGSAGSAKRSLWDMSVCSTSTGSSSSRAATNSRNTASQVVDDDMSLALSCLPKPSALSSYGPSTTPGTKFQAVGAHGTSKYDLTTASTSAMPHDNSATYDTTYSAGASSSNTSSRSTNQEKSLWVSAISDGARGGGSQSSTPSFDSSTPLPYYANASTKTSSHSSSASGVTGVSGGSGRHAAAASHSNTNAGGRSPRPAASTGSAGKHGVAHKKPHKQSHLASANAPSYPAGMTAPAHHHHASGGGYQAHPLSYMPSTGASGTGLRPVIIDGSNIAMSHGKHEIFSCRGILLAVKFFQERGHLNIRAMIPTSVFRTNHAKPVRNKEILEHLRKCDHLTETPSRLVNGRLIVPYDDRFILQVAQGNGGVVVSNDQYRDLIGEEQFRVIIETRLVSFIFVDDLFLPAKDPLGRSGPTLDAMLQF
eukprot:scpid61756/ scgid26284/ Ribonuclease ZC3H12A; Zinc finger CCCH domain-containing protein 12A